MINRGVGVVAGAGMGRPGARCRGRWRKLRAEATD